MRTTLLAALVFTALLAACTSDDDDEPRPDATATPTASSDATADASATSESDGAAGSVGDGTALATRYVSADGSGVAVRDACEDGARTGDAWPDGTEVKVAQVGAGECDGWSLVLSGGGSWVRDDYLSDEAPRASVSAPDGTTPRRPPPQPTSGPPPPAPTPTTPPTLPALVIQGAGGSTYTLDELKGVAVLQSVETFTYLGRVSSNVTQLDSICNPVGQHGSFSSPVSIRNPDGQFGRKAGGSPYSEFFNSEHSAYMPSATTPPRMMLGDDLVAYVSKSDSSLPRIDPDTLFFHLGCPLG